jgi:hypothetical protein
MSLVFYKEMKLKCNMEEYVNCCSRKKRAGIAWGRVGIWKLRGIMRVFKNGRCPLCYELEEATHILLICTETKESREEVLCKKWMGLDKDTAFKKITGCKKYSRTEDHGERLAWSQRKVGE